VAWLTRRRILALGLLFGLPALFLGAYADDAMLLYDLRARGGGARAATQLYHLLAWPGGGGAAHQPWLRPWWASPQFRTDFFRPLSGLSFWLDERLWPGCGVLSHLHSLLWWALVMWLAARLLSRLLPEKTALLAFLLFAVDDGHWMPMAWLSNRHAALAAAAVLAGILAHLRWRDGHFGAGLPLSLVAYAVGLSFGEAALQPLTYLFADELFGTGPRRGRFLRLLPATALVLTYGAVRHSLGAGVAGSGIYYDPLADPIGFLGVLPARLAILCADLFGGLSSDLWFVLPRIGAPLVMAGAAVTAVVAWLWWRTLRALPEKEARALRGLTLGALFALVPGAAGVPGSRLLLGPALGASAAIATIILHHATPALARVWLVGAHLLLAPLALLTDQLVAIHIARAAVRVAADSDLDGDVVQLAAPDPTLSIYPPYFEALSGRARLRSFRALSFAPLDLSLQRTAPDQLRITARGGPFFASAVERLFTDVTPRPGQVILADGMRVHVDSQSELTFTFEAPLERFRFVAWHAGALRRIALPPVGGRLEVAREPGILGF
jgi:hypothetical protein